MARIGIAAAALWIALGGLAQAQCAMPEGGAAEKAALAEAVNRFRAGEGLGALALSPALERAATAHACDMVARNRFTHSGGGGLAARLRRAGCRPGRAGETIAMGNAGGVATLGQWLDSPPHRRILVARGLGAMGIGLAAPRPGQRGGPRWVLNLADGC